MSKLDSLITVEYNKKKYTVAIIEHTNNKIPVLLDREIYKIIKRLNKKWYINDKNHIYCLHTEISSETETYPVYMHEVVIKLLLKNPDLSPVSIGSALNIKYLNKRPIIHINNIHFDNRIENLQFDIPDKEHSKNSKKKSRIINLKKYGIDVNKLPTYLWYLKPDKSHGDRFVIELPNGVTWRTTSSKKVSLRYKLEEAKKYLRFMKSNNPDMMKEYSMNGDLTAMGTKLYNSYNIIIEKAGFTIDRPQSDNTKKFLNKDTSDLTDFEIYLLENFDPKKGSVDINNLFKSFQDISSDVTSDSE
jgi:hypothetical protein